MTSQWNFHRARRPAAVAAGLALLILATGCERGGAKEAAKAAPPPPPAVIVAEVPQRAVQVFGEFVARYAAGTLV